MTREGESQSEAAGMAAGSKSFGVRQENGVRGLRETSLAAILVFELKGTSRNGRIVRLENQKQGR
jgi:hypothetical protein